VHLRGRSRRLGDVVVVELDGDADLAAVPQLSQVLARAIDTADTADTAGITVDLDGLTVLDNAALGQIVGAAATARRRDVSFTLVCTNERLRERLHDTRLDQIIDVVDRPRR
jgi:anti-anti-sigma factor